MDKLDLVLIMSVNPGFGGQTFIPRGAEEDARSARASTLHRARAGRDIRLEVDGGIKVDNIARSRGGRRRHVRRRLGDFRQARLQAVIDAMRAELAKAGAQK